jgi:hypothetical protein
MKNYIYIASLVLLLVSCSKDYELTKSVYKQDLEFTDLPAYSEWGYNTFGVYYDRTPFVFNDETIPAKALNTNNEFSFLLSGQLGAYSYYSSSYSEMSLKFVFTDTIYEEYQDLVSLNNTTIDLTNPLYKVILEKDQSTDTLDIISGELYFKRVQNLKVDTKPVEIILSGYFGFKALIGGKPVTFSEGRFDVGIGTSNFYYY